MQIYPNQFNKEIAQGLKPCYLVFGDEPQQKFDVIESIRALAKKNGFEERTVLVADTGFSWNQLLDATQSMSLFSSQQFIELELPTGKPGAEGSKMLQQIADTLNPDILLLVHGPKIGKDVQRGKWFKVLDAKGVSVLCYPLEGRQLSSWLNQQLQHHGLSVSATGLKIIADFCEGNMLAAKQEIDKLALLYPKSTVTDEQIEYAMVDQSRYNVFQLVDVMLAGDSTRCVKMLYRLESEGLEPNIIIWALIREWETLWKLHAAAQSREPIQWQKYGIWRNRQAYYQQAMNRLNAESLLSIQQALTEADLAFKQNVVSKPFVKLCHLCMLFMGINIYHIPLMEA
ncbi:DNA polymerase III subunit delta [Alteromonas sp. 345S023]|uniref:DNA polymerase III subunit delta n=1 Tax=Alteromonas profundi TaxID=2696062 RepID=A0A7X5RLE0_9ALTE|nr:DNA polymerase III subunit delta [Alteromonas profundi]NDV91619.1 DNA polymerase III subunit delta [Alteromonas profundi]